MVEDPENPESTIALRAVTEEMFRRGHILEFGIPGPCGVETQALRKRRERGTTIVWCQIDFELILVIVLIVLLATRGFYNCNIFDRNVNEEEGESISQV